VYGYAGDFATAHLTLSGVNSATYLHAKSYGLGLDGARAPYSSRRPVKRCENAIARSVKALSAEMLDLSLDSVHVLLEQVTPCLVAQSRGLLRRVDDVHKHHSCKNRVLVNRGSGSCHELFDLGFDPMDITDVEEMIVTGQFNVSSPGDVLRQIPPIANVHQPITYPM